MWLIHRVNTWQLVDVERELSLLVVGHGLGDVLVLGVGMGRRVRGGRGDGRGALLLAGRRRARARLAAAAASSRPTRLASDGTRRCGRNTHISISLRPNLR